MKRLFLLASVLVACTDSRPPEQYGFVALLGRDTVSVERVSRSRTRLVTDGVDRFPLVRLRHSEFDLGGDGHIRRMVMDVRTPSGKTPAERGRRITGDFTGGKARIFIRDSSGVRDTTWTIGDVLTVPHVSMMYSVIELEVASALAGAGQTGAQAGEPIRFRQFYPDRDIGASFALHQGFVQPLGDGKVELRHDWLSGIGELTVDSAGRMLTYSGARTTYQVAVSRTSELPDVTLIGAQLAAAEQRVGAAQLSVRDTVRASIGGATFTVDYSRPLARGRELLGKVVPFDYVWRTGANAATQFTTSVAITIGGLSVPAGTYTLWSIPRTNGAELIVNKQTGQWGTQYQESSDLGRARLATSAVSDTVEKFTIAIDAKDATHGALSLAWGTFRWTAPIVIR